MTLNLPLHPTLLHPRTGKRLRAIWVRPDGRVIYPIMGGDGTEDDANDKGDDKADDKKADDKPDDKKSSDQGKDLGFPVNTPVAEMTVDQRAAYWQHQSRKHEERATEYRSAVGGKTAAEVKAELEAADALKREKMSDSEKAVEDAKREAREATAREYGTKSVRMAFELALRGLSSEDRSEFIEDLDLSRFLTDSGDVDTAKVIARAEKIAPADKGQGNGKQFDFGGGKRGGSPAATGVAAGASRYAARKNSATSTTN